MSKNARNKGITLIALIITIIVLLILAGVTISAITGNESVMEKAKQAKEKTDAANEMDAIKLAVVNSIAKSNNKLDVDIDTLKSGLNGIVEDESINSITNEQTKWCVHGKTGEIYIIDEDGTVMTAYENAKSHIDIYINDPYAKVIGTIECVHVATSIHYLLPYTEQNNNIEYGFIYNNDGNIDDISLLRLENVGTNNIKVSAGRSGTNLPDTGHGVIAVFYVTCIDEFGNEITVYTDNIGGNFAELSDQSS